MILRPVRPQSPSGPPMKNLPVGLTCQTVSLGDAALGQGLEDVGLDQRPDVVRGQVLVDVLVRQDDLGDADRHAVLVANRHLALGVGAEALLGARAARVGQVLQDAVGIVDRRRHQFRRLTAGVAEHDALVAGALFLVAGLVDAGRDVGRLRVQQDLDLGGLVMEAVLLVADVLDGGAGRGLDDRGIDGGAAHLAGDHDAVGRGQRLAGDADLVGVEAGLGAFAEEQVDHLVGDPVADLVGMPFGDGLAGEQVVRTGHAAPPRSIERSRAGRSRSPVRRSKSFDEGLLNAARSFRQAFGAISFGKQNDSGVTGTAAALREQARVPGRFRPPAGRRPRRLGGVVGQRRHEVDDLLADARLLDAHEGLVEQQSFGGRQEVDHEAGTLLGEAAFGGAPSDAGMSSKKKAGGTLRTPAICCRRLAPMRLVPFSYF